MYFKISHKNKSVHKRIAHFLELFSNHMFILGRILNRIKKAVHEASSVTQKFVTQKFSDTKIRRQQKIAAVNLIFGSIIGGNCLLPPKIARTVESSPTSRYKLVLSRFIWEPIQGFTTLLLKDTSVSGIVPSWSL